MTSIINSGQILPGFLLGLILLTVIYNIILSLSFRDKSYLYLCIFFLTGGISLLLTSRYDFNNSLLSVKSLPFLIFAALASLVEYSRLYFKAKSINAFWEKVLTWERNLLISGIIISVFLNPVWLIGITAFIIPAAVITVIVTGIISYKNGHQKAVMDTFVWSLFLISLAPLVLKSFALIPGTFPADLSIQFGFILLMILTPFTLKYRVNEERNENYSTRADLIEDMKQSEKILRDGIEEQTEEINEINMMLMDRAIELGSINQLSDKINSSLNIDEVLHNACVELVKIFPARSAGIALLNQSRENLITRSYYSETTDSFSLRMEISLNGNTPFIDVIESQKPVMIDNMADSAFKKYLFDSNQIELGNTVLIVPIISLREVIGTIILTAGEADYKFNRSEIDLAKTIAQQIAGSVENARLFTRTEKALGTAVNDLEIGRQIQADFFPAVLEEIEGWELIPYFKAARQVSGDFYDVFHIDNSAYTAFIIGDVCDKGVGAALFMVLFRSLLRAYSLKENGYDDVKMFLKHIISVTNNYIAETHSKANMFAAIFYGIVDPAKNEIYYINGGLEAPVILDSSGDIINKLAPTGPVVGMFPDMEFTVNSVSLNPGDILFAYTDGSTDAKNSRQELFGEELLLKTISSPWSSGFSLLFNLNTCLGRHIGKQNQYDDITQFVVRRKLSSVENKHSITRKADINNLEVLREFVEKAVLYSGLKSDFVFAFKLVTEEICTNIIKYGYEGGETGDITVEFEIEAETALLKIIDNGIGYVPDEKDSADINEDWQTRKIGGLGITLVKGFMDKIDFTEGPGNSNCVMLRKKLN